jgi:voltage-gated potassium channel
MTNKKLQYLNILNYFWYAIVVLSCTYISFFVPLKLVFNDSYFSWRFFQADQLAYFLLSMDIFVSWYKSQKLGWEVPFGEEYKLNLYNKRLIVVDIVSIIPFSWILGIPILELFRLIKMLKVSYYVRVLRLYEVQISDIITLVFFFYWTIILAHWISCFWIHLIGINPMYDDYTNYIRAIYWAVTTLTTIGYGDITPEQNNEMIFTMFVQFLGVALYGYIISSISKILLKEDPAKEQYRENINRLNALISYRKLPKDLQNKLRNYYTYLWEKRLGFNEHSFLGSLPPSLRREMLMYLKKDAVEKIPVFKGADSRLITEIAQCLEPMVFTPNDIVFHAGDQAEEMYFIIKGTMQVISADGTILAVLTEGAFFGEMALFMNRTRSATISALSFCDVYMLKKHDVDRVFAKHPAFAKKIREEAEQREKSNKQMREGEKRD